LLNQYTDVSHKHFLAQHAATLLGFVLFILALLSPALIASGGANMRSTLHTAPITQSIVATTAKDLSRIFHREHYPWPPQKQNGVPLLLLNALPNDFADIRHSNTRRELFLQTMLPLLLIENRQLREQRALASWLFEKKLPQAGSPARVWLNALAKTLRVRGNLEQAQQRQTLLMRLDEIPLSLALAQSAIETGWGTSRFAREGNSLFGQWTFIKGNGLTPSQRDEGASHQVASFSDLRASVRSYMRNLNTGNAYHEFRRARAAQRSSGQALDAQQLVAHLHRYSQRGEAYVDELRRMMRSPSITRLNGMRLSVR
jgi:Bax protein